MKVSFNWLKELVDLKGKTPENIAEILTFRGIEVEAVEDLSQGFEDVISAQVVKKEKHPEADRLSLCQVNTGKETLQIVCGAQNFKQGDKVLLAQIGANLPNGLKIEKSKIRGQVSFGMLCSEEELGLSESSEGILVLPENTPLGKKAAKLFDRDDVTLDCSLTPNRGDCLSHIGIARELASHFGKKINLPKTKLLKPTKSSLKLKCAAQADGPQFWGVKIEGLKVGASPEWLVKRLEAIGQRSINNVVDATNYVLMETGQPQHAYDAKLLNGNQLSIRFAKKDEKLPLLDGQTITLKGTELVIADDKDASRAVALAGVMGGGNSEVSDQTTSIVLECAEFSAQEVRKASTLHQRKTEAAHRFERGIDPQGLQFAISRLAELIIELAGGKVTAVTYAFHSLRDPKKNKKIQIDVSHDYFKRFLGLDCKPVEIQKTFQSLGFSFKKTAKSYQFSPPSYRLDIHIKEDLADELARCVGYDKIPSTIPVLSSAPRPLLSPHQTATVQFDLLDQARDVMRGLGFLESIHYAWTKRAWLEKFGLSSEVEILNPLSEDQEVLVPSLIPGLVESALYNWNHHFSTDDLAIRLFQLRPTYQKADTETGVLENWKLSLVLSGPRFEQALNADQKEVDFFDLKAVVEQFFSAMGVRGVRVVHPMGEIPGLLHPGKTAEVLVGKNSAGFFGLIHPQKAESLKLKKPLWLCELDWQAIESMCVLGWKNKEFRTWSEFPTIERDFALLVTDTVQSEQILKCAQQAGKPLLKNIKIFDTYKGSQVGEGMTSIAVRACFSADGRSLQEKEADDVSAKMLDRWKKELGIELRA